MDNFAFQEKVLNDLGELKGELRGVNGHLKTLNGSVARHEGAVAQLQARDQRREEEADSNTHRIASVQQRIQNMSSEQGEILKLKQQLTALEEETQELKKERDMIRAREEGRRELISTWKPVLTVAAMAAGIAGIIILLRHANDFLQHLGIK